MIHWYPVNVFSLEAIVVLPTDLSSHPSVTGYLKCVRAADSDQFNLVFLMSISKGSRKSQIKQV